MFLVEAGKFLWAGGLPQVSAQLPLNHQSPCMAAPREATWGQPESTGPQTSERSLVPLGQLLPSLSRQRPLKVQAPYRVHVPFFLPVHPFLACNYHKEGPGVGTVWPHSGLQLQGGRSWNKGSDGSEEAGLTWGKPPAHRDFPASARNVSGVPAKTHFSGLWLWEGWSSNGCWAQKSTVRPETPLLALGY